MKPNRSLLTPLLLAAMLSIGSAQASGLPKGFRESTQSVANGGVIHYVRGGKGEPVVLVHGFGETAHMWRPLLSTLAKQYTVITPDLPGLDGSSFMPTGVYDMKTVAQRLHDFVRRLGYKRIRLVGHDIGLMAVYAYAAQYPDEVRKLVLLDAPIPGVGETWPKIFNNPALWHFHFPNSPIALKLVQGRERTFLDHFWISFSGNPKAVAIPESERETYTRIYARPGAMAAALGYFKAFPTDAIQNQAFLAKGKLPMPVLTIEGERGMGGALQIQAKEAAENVRSIILPKAGHWLLSERLPQVKAALLPFLSEAAALKVRGSSFCAVAQKPTSERRLTPQEIGHLSAKGAGLGTSGLSGIRTRVLYGDPARAGLYTIELSVPANVRIEAHTHPDDRVVTVVSGTWYFGYGSHFDVHKLKALTPGSFYTEPPAQPHFAKTGASPVKVHISGVGPTGTEYVSAASVKA